MSLPASSSFALTDAASTNSFASLFHSLPASVVCSFLRISDVLALSSIDRAMRQLILSSPAVWRTKVFKCFPERRRSTSSSSPTSLPSWCSVVQVVYDQSGSRHFHDSKPEVWCLRFVASLLLCPNLRCIHNQGADLTRYGRLMQPVHEPAAPSSSLSSMRHLTRLSLNMCGQLTVDDMSVLATLPALASFATIGTRFESGNDDTLRQWQARIVSKQQQRRGKRKADQIAAGADEAEEDEKDDEIAEGHPQQGLDKGDAEADNRHEEEEEEWGPEAEEDGEEEDADDPSLPRKHSALLLFLHALASKQSLVHLELVFCDLTPFALDHMPVWPHLLSLAVKSNDRLNRYRFEMVSMCFPSLTSLSVSNCSDAAIANFVKLPAPEELRFPDYLTTDADNGGRVLTTSRGFRTLSKAAKLRAVYYSLPLGSDEETPSLDALTSLFTLNNLTRITISADWPIHTLLTTHHFQHLRCLEMIAQVSCGGTTCPQTDEQLMPLVKPLDMVIDGREQRQAARAAVRLYRREEEEWRNGNDDAGEPIIPADNAANFPSLECLALPYEHYNCGHGDYTGEVSTWMKRQLRRSYEYEVAAEWEAECSTLGSAELLKSIMG